MSKQEKKSIVTASQHSPWASLLNSSAKCHSFNFNEKFNFFPYGDINSQKTMSNCNYV